MPGLEGGGWKHKLCCALAAYPTNLPPITLSRVAYGGFWLTSSERSDLSENLMWLR